MTPDEILQSLFPTGYRVDAEGSLIGGHGALPGGGRIHVLGVAEGTYLGVEEALWLAGRVLQIDAGMRCGTDPAHGGFRQPTDEQAR